jgi:hypothetical protein
MDSDEGWYGYAAERAVDSELPYKDFFFPQTPLVAYVYGPWMRVLHNPWYAWRELSAVLAAAVGTLLYVHCAHRLGHTLALGSVVAFASTTLVITWFPTVKTYALSTLLLLAALVVVEWNDEAHGREWFTAGLLLGLAVDARLLFVAPALAFLPRLLRQGRRRAGTALGGLALGLTPILFFLAEAPDAFVWDTLRYHAHRSSGGLVGDFHQKEAVLGALAGLPTSEHAVGPQLLLLTVATAAGAAAAIARRRPLPLALGVALLASFASILPTPTYTQYFAVLTPFLLVGAAELLSSFAGRSPVEPAGIWAGGVALVVYVALAAPTFRNYVRLHRPTELDRTWQVAEFVERHTHPGERVLSTRPAFLVGTHALAVRGFENQYAPETARAVGLRTAAKYHLGSIEDVAAAIREGRTRLVVGKYWLLPGAQGAAPLEGSRYRLVATVADVPIYRLRSR